MNIKSKIDTMKHNLATPEEIAKQEAKIEYRIEREKASPFPTVERDTVTLITNSDVSPSKKFTYFKQLIAYLNTEDELFYLNRAIIEVGRTNPDTQQQMFDTLKEFVKYPKSCGDRGTPLSGMYDQLYRLGNNELKDNPDFAVNFLEVMKSEMQAERYQSNGFRNLDRAWYCLDKVVSDYPEHTALAYEVYRDVRAIGKERTYTDTSLEEAILCQKMIEQLGNAGSEADKVDDLVARKEQLEAKCWKNTRESVILKKHNLAVYVQAFPEHADKALNVARNEVFIGNTMEDRSLRDAFEKTAKKQPQFAENWSKCRMEYITKRAIQNTKTV